MSSHEHSVASMAANAKISLRRQVVSALKWAAATRLLTQLFNWAVTLMVIRILSPADYGLLAMAAVFTWVLMLFVEGGVGLAVVQAQTIDENQLRQMFGLVIIVNLTLFIVLFGCAPLISQFFEEPRLIPIVRVLAWQFILMIFSAIPTALLARNLNFRMESMISLVGSVVGSVTTLTLALAEFGVWSLVWGQLSAIFVGTLCLNIVSPFVRRPLMSFTGARKLMMFSGHVTFSRLLSFSYMQTDIMIGGKFLGRDSLGVYSVALHLASLPVQRISSLLNPVALSAFARVQDQPAHFSAYLLRSIKALFLLALPVFWGMSSIAEELIPLLLGPKWQEAMLPFKLLALIMPLRILAPFINSANFGMGRPDIVTTCLFVLGCFMVPAYLMGVQWQVIGLTLAWVIAFPLAFAVSLYIALPSMGLRVAQIARAVAPTLACGAGMYAVVEISRLAMGEMPALLRIGILIGVGAAVFLALSWCINREGVRDALALLRK
jgi:O-antigen/teichoic acid export membrane protein